MLFDSKRASGNCFASNQSGSGSCESRSLSRVLTDAVLTVPDDAGLCRMLGIERDLALKSPNMPENFEPSWVALNFTELASLATFHAGAPAPAAAAKAMPGGRDGQHA